MKPASKAAFRLMHEGTLALADVESNGIRVDVDYLISERKRLDQKVEEIRERLEADDIFKIWKKTFRGKTNLTSRLQLGRVLFEELEYECLKYTPKGKPKVDVELLEQLDLDFTRLYLEYTQLLKLRSTYINNVLGEACDGFLHPFFNLNLVWTYRSSSDHPNFQNIPARNETTARAIRSAFVPRDGHVLVEIDYSQIEVRIAACYHRDPTMIEYIEQDYDLHRDVAADCFLLPVEQITSSIRKTAKGSFTFAEFYGDYYPQVAKNLWSQIHRYGLETKDGLP